MNKKTNTYIVKVVFEVARHDTKMCRYASNKTVGRTGVPCAGNRDIE
jgi:hypothetical protein